MSEAHERGIPTGVLSALLVLLVVVGGLLIVPRILGHPTEVLRQQAAADIANVRAALNRFRLNCDRFPTNKEGLTCLLAGPKIVGWSGPYLAVVPIDPWKRPYHFSNLGSDLFEVTSYGRDGKPGGEGADEDVPFGP